MLMYVFSNGTNHKLERSVSLQSPIFADIDLAKPTYHNFPLRSFYVLPEPSKNPTRKSSIIVPCWIVNTFMGGNMILERKNKVSRKWEQVRLSSRRRVEKYNVHSAYYTCFYLCFKPAFEV